jgi:hypothetical protein
MPGVRPSREPIPSRAREGSGAIRAHAVRITGALLLAYLLAAVVVPRAAASPRWQLPVTGPVARAFDYAGDPFAAGRHRGVDFAVRPGQAVRSACAGRVVFAGTAGSSGPTVSVRCGSWRVAYLPLGSLAVARGARVEQGARLGTAAGTGPHAGLHVGVRRQGRRWAYVDPLPFFGARPPSPPLGPAPRGVRPPVAPRVAPRPVPVGAAPRRRLVPAHPPRAAPFAQRPAPRAHPLAPWLAWAGLALVLGGAGAAWRRRARPAAGAPRPIEHALRT